MDDQGSLAVEVISKTAMRPGNRTVYTVEIAALICERLSAGESLRSICRSDEFPSESTVRTWVLDDREGFAAQYARAREMQAHAMADEMLDIADDGSNDWMQREGKGGAPGWELNGEHVQRSKQRIEARKWLLSKMLPKAYGDKITQEHTGPDGAPMTVQAIHRVIVDPAIKG